MVHPDLKTLNLEDIYLSPYCLAPLVLSVLTLTLLYVIHLRFFSRHQFKLGGLKRVDSRVGRSWTVWCSLFCITVLAAFLRFKDLGAESFDLLEYTYIQVSLFHFDNLFDVLTNFVAVQQQHAPPYHMLLGAMLHLDFSEWMTRFPSAIFGVLCVLFTFVFGRLVLDRRVSLVACLLLALSPAHILYSRDATPYSLFCFLCLASFYFLYMAFISPRRLSIWLLFIGVNVLSFSCHTEQVVILISQTFFIVLLCLFKIRCVEWRAKLTEFLMALSVIGILSSPLIATFIYGHAESGRELARTGYLYFPPARAYGSYFNLILAMAGFKPDHSWAIPILLGVFLWGTVRIVRQMCWQKIFLLLLPSFAVHFGLCIQIWRIRDMTGGDYFAVRHYLFAVPSLLLFICFSLFESLSPRSTWLRMLQVPIVCVAVVGFCIALAGYDHEILSAPQKPDSRSVAEYLKSNLADGDATYVMPADFYSHLLYYYLRTRDEVLSDPLGEPWWREVDGGGLHYGPMRERDFRGHIKFDDILAKNNIQRLWVIYYREEMLGLPTVWHGEVEKRLAQLNDRHNLLKKGRFSFIDVYLSEICWRQ